MLTHDRTSRGQIYLRHPFAKEGRANMVRHDFSMSFTRLALQQWPTTPTPISVSTLIETAAISLVTDGNDGFGYALFRAIGIEHPRAPSTMATVTDGTWPPPRQLKRLRSWLALLTNPNPDNEPLEVTNHQAQPQSQSNPRTFAQLRSNPNGTLSLVTKELSP